MIIKKFSWDKNGNSSHETWVGIICAIIGFSIGILTHTDPVILTLEPFMIGSALCIFTTGKAMTVPPPFYKRHLVTGKDAKKVGYAYVIGALIIFFLNLFYPKYY